VAEWLRSGLQIRAPRFDSGRGLHLTGDISQNPQVAAAVILAGGTGRRMGGRDKSRLTVNGTLFSHRLAEILSPQARQMAVVAPAEHTPFIPDPCARLNDLLDRDGRPIGPLGGLAAAGIWASKILEDHQWVITAPVDCPLFPTDFSQRALDAARPGTEIVIGAYNDRTYPVCALWRVGALAAIKTYLAPEVRDYSVRSYMMTRAAIHIDFYPWYATNPFSGANTPAELSALAHHLKQKPKT
jgi:molybdenum cofactor guanylyltransferase